MIHQITATWAFDEAKKRQDSTRRCPKCDGEHIASERLKNAMVVCETCGAPILSDDENQEREAKNETENQAA